MIPVIVANKTGNIITVTEASRQSSDGAGVEHRIERKR